MRKTHEHSVSLSEEVERNIDFLYHSTADHVNKIAKQAGDPNLESVITSRLVRLLEAKTLWESFRNTQSLPEMRPERNSNGRGRRAGSSAWLGQEADLSRGSSGTRTLSAKARRAISKAQHIRWAKYHENKAAERERWKQSSKARRERGVKQKPRTYRKNRSSGMKGYWANMTEEERSQEMTRRHKVAAEKRKASAA